MKKFYCLYNRNNLPFSWKLKQANEKPIANFKSREDCLNYYLSFGNVGIIWFQKASSKATKKENLKDSFDGYIKSEMKDGVLVHRIGVVPKTSENATRILKRNLFHSLQIDPETGRDLLDEKGIDRLYNNKNSYLIFDKDIAEEILTVYDAKPMDIDNEEIYPEVEKPIPDDKDLLLSTPEILREKIKNSSSSAPSKKVDEKDIVLDIDVEYNDEKKVKEDIPPSAKNHVKQENNSFYYSNTGLNDFNHYNNNYSNQSYSNQGYSNGNGMWNTKDFAVNINDFNFGYDFGNYKLKAFTANQQRMANNNFGQYFNNNGKILKNNFYKYYRSGGTNMNSNNNKFNGNNLNNGSNDVWVPVGTPNQNAQRSNGTVEFTAVPNQMLNTEVNPLGANTMIFNPYGMQQNQFPNLPSNNAPETLIQPIIQPIIQTVYQQPKTTVLEPIINEPIMANASYNSYAEYSQYNPVTGTLVPSHTSTLVQNMMQQQPKPYQETSEFKFNNNEANANNTNSLNTSGLNENADANSLNANSASNSNINASMPLVNNEEVENNNIAQKNVANSAVARPVNRAPQKNNGSRPQRPQQGQNGKKTANQNQISKANKPKSKKKMLYSLMGVSLLVIIAIIVVIVLIVTNIIVIK